MTTSNIVFIDSRVDGYEALIASFGDDTEWFVLEADKDGVEQMQSILSGYANLDSIQVISHGSTGTLYLGSTVLNNENLLAYQSQLAAIGSALTETGDILLYGCNVAQGDTGLQLINSLALITGADVAASDDITGVTGDWLLERSIGQIEKEQYSFNDLKYDLTPSGLIRISSTVTVGSLLTIIDELTDEDGIGDRIYTWQTSQNGTNWKPVSTGPSLSIIGNYVGYKIRVVADYTDGLGNPESSTSNTSEPVGREFIGTTGIDTLTGTLGSDEFYGGTGDDSINGGKNRVSDLAIYSGLAADYSLSYSNGSISIKDLNAENGDDGVDYLKSIEYFEFSDKNIRIECPQQYLNETGYVKKTIAPKITSLTDGDSIIGWVSIGGELITQRISSGGFVVGDETFHLSGLYDFTIAKMNDGGYILAYSSNQISLQRFNSYGNAETEVLKVNTTQTSNMLAGDGPTVCELLDGGYIVVWTHHNDTDGQGIFAQRFNSSNEAIGGEFVVNSVLSYNQNMPKVAGLDNGNFVVAWLSQQASGYRDVRFQIFDPSGNPVGTETDPTNIFANQFGSASQLLIVSLSNGRFALAWNGPTNQGSSGGVHLSIFDSDGSRIGEEFFLGSGNYSYMTAVNDHTIDIGFEVTTGFATPKINSHITIDADSLQNSYYSASVGGFNSQQSIVGMSESGIRIALEESGVNTNYFHLVSGSASGKASIFGTTANDDIYLTGNNINGVGLNGDDTYYISSYNSVVEGIDEGVDLVISSISYELPSNVENLVLIENAGGGSGNELNNSLIGNYSNNSLSGKFGDDYIFGDSGNDWIEGNEGDDQLDGGDGLDYVVYQSAASFVSVNLMTGVVYGGDGADSIINFENIIGSNFGDILVGDNENNFIRGMDGNDTITGGLGNDTLFGEQGADTYVYYLSENGVDSIADDFEYGSFIKVVGASFSTSPSVGNGEDIGLFEIQTDYDSSRGYGVGIYIGTDLNPGADIVIYHSGYIRPEEIGAIGDLIFRTNYLPRGEIWISGTYIQDQTLYAANNISDNDGLGEIDYQWHANGIAINGATDASYTLTQAEVGKTITVLASYTDGHGMSESLISISNGTVININDLPVGDVTITGILTQGETLTATNTLVDLDGLGEISYQWVANGVAIAGATSSTYTLTQAEVGKTVTVVASYTDGYGSAESVSSGATAAVANVNDLPSGEVTISGTPTQGETLTATNTLVDLDGLSDISYQWKANGVAIAGATSSTYTLTQAEVGKTVTVVASYTDGQDTFESIASQSTEVVLNSVTFGSEGNDIFLINHRLDAVIEEPNAGWDTVVSSVSTTLTDNVEALILVNPQFILQNGFTSYVTGPGISGTGNDEANLLVGTAAANRLAGVAGDDQIYAGAGNDLMIGGAGNDSLSGGAGADTFVFDSLSGIDRITDFSAQDQLWFDDAVFTGLTAGALTSSALGQGAGRSSALTADERLIFDTTSGALYYDADGLGGANAEQVAWLMNGSGQAAPLLFSQVMVV